MNQPVSIYKDIIIKYYEDSDLDKPQSRYNNHVPQRFALEKASSLKDKSVSSFIDSESSTKENNYKFPPRSRLTDANRVGASKILSQSSLKKVSNADSSSNFQVVRRRSNAIYSQQPSKHSLEFSSEDGQQAALEALQQQFRKELGLDDATLIDSDGGSDNRNPHENVPFVDIRQTENGRLSEISPYFNINVPDRKKLPERVVKVSNRIDFGVSAISVITPICSEAILKFYPNSASVQNILVQITSIVTAVTGCISTIKSMILDFMKIAIKAPSSRSKSQYFMVHPSEKRRLSPRAVKISKAVSLVISILAVVASAITGILSSIYRDDVEMQEKLLHVNAGISVVGGNVGTIKSKILDKMKKFVNPTRVVEQFA